MNVALGAMFLLLQAPGNFPGGSMLLAIVIGTLVMAFTLLWVYSEFSAAMPRSGGDYVFVSRALHPFVGWLLSWSQGMWLIFFWIGFNAWFALTFALRSRSPRSASVTGHPGWINVSNDLLGQVHDPRDHHAVVGHRARYVSLIFATSADLRLAVVLAGRRSGCSGSPG